MSKGKAPKPPDYKPLAEASIQSAQIMADLGYAQMDMAQWQFEQTMPFVQQVTDAQLNLMNRSADQADFYLQMQSQAWEGQLALQERALGQQDTFMGMQQQAWQAQNGLMERSLSQVDRQISINERATNRQLELLEESAAMGREYYEYMKETFRPLEKQMVEDALKYNTQAEFERQAGQAAADVANRTAIERSANERAMASMGVNPNSGRFQQVGEQGALQSAALGAGAMNNARRSAEMTGYARMMDAIGLGRGLPQASLGAYQLASQNAGQVAGTSGQLAGTMAGIAGNAGNSMLNSATSGANSALGVAGNIGSGMLNTASSGYNAAMGNAMNSGNAAVGNYMMPYNNLVSGHAQGANQIASGQQMMLGGLGNVLGAQNSAYNAGLQHHAGSAAGLGGFLGGVIGMI